VTICADAVGKSNSATRALDFLWVEIGARTVPVEVVMRFRGMNSSKTPF
jgi:hypothetical protein